MTNREIKLELCKAVLHNSNFVPLDQSFLKNMYEWIMEDEELEVTD